VRFGLSEPSGGWGIGPQGGSRIPPRPGPPRLASLLIRFGNSSSTGRTDVIVTIAKVADFDQFLKTFSSKGAEKRKEHGSKGSQIFRDPDDPSRLWVIFDWEMEDYERFLSDPEIPAIAQELALQGPPVEPESVGEYDS
jgi:hypothetical protein